MTETLPSPALPRRLAALLYDSLLVLPLIMVAVALCTGLHVAVSSATGSADYSATLHPLLVRLIALLTVVSFYCYCWCRGGQTLGMKAWRIKVQGFDGQALSLRQSIIRCFATLPSLAPAGLGYWWCLFNRHGRYWHDYLSGTELKLLPKPETSGK